MIIDFLKGATSYFNAFSIIRTYKLWGYFIAPFMICVLLATVILGTAWSISDNIGSTLIGFYPIEWGKGVLEQVFSVFGGLAIAVFGFIIFKQLVIALSSPFMSPMSEKVERHLRGHSGALPARTGTFVKDLIRGLVIAFRNIIRELSITLVLFILGLIPVLTPFTTVLIFLVQAYYAGFGNFDFMMERHYNVKESVQFIRANRWLTIGNGAVFIGLLLTVFGFIVVLPLGTVAAVSAGMDRISPTNKPALNDQELV